MSLKGVVFDISRYCLDDGPGIRTTVFLKGCPLRCKWCHNPESNSMDIEIGYDVTKCIGCRACEKICPCHCHEFLGEKHILHRENCIACGECVKICEMEALSQIGRLMGVEEVMAIVKRDKSFYKNSQGGLTLSGGEMMYQFDFAKALSKAAKDEGLSTCVETSGFVKKEKLLEIIPYIDIFLYDCKQMNSALHEEYTWVSNRVILENLFEIDRHDKEIVLRMPIIPRINDTHEHFQKTGELVNQLKNVKSVEVLPYHPLGLSKAALIDRVMGYTEKEIPSDQLVEQWVNELQQYTDKKVIRSKV